MAVGGTQGQLGQRYTHPIIDLNSTTAYIEATIRSHYPTPYAISPDKRALGSWSGGCRYLGKLMFSSFTLAVEGDAYNAVCPGGGGVNPTVTGGYLNKSNGLMAQTAQDLLAWMRAHIL